MSPALDSGPPLAESLLASFQLGGGDGRRGPANPRSRESVPWPEASPSWVLLEDSQSPPALMLALWGGEVSGEEIGDCCDAEGGKANSHSAGYLLLQLGCLARSLQIHPFHALISLPTHMSSPCAWLFPLKRPLLWVLLIWKGGGQGNSRLGPAWEGV